MKRRLKIKLTFASIYGSSSGVAKFYDLHYKNFSLVPKINFPLGKIKTVYSEKEITQNYAKFDMRSGFRVFARG